VSAPVKHRNPTGKSPTVEAVLAVLNSRAATFTPGPSSAPGVHRDPSGLAGARAVLLGRAAHKAIQKVAAQWTEPLAAEEVAPSSETRLLRATFLSGRSPTSPGLCGRLRRPGRAPRAVLAAGLIPRATSTGRSTAGAGDLPARRPPAAPGAARPGGGRLASCRREREARSRSRARRSSRSTTISLILARLVASITATPRQVTWWWSAPPCSWSEERSWSRSSVRSSLPSWSCW
jgi:hypothetical protein